MNTYHLVFSIKCLLTVDKMVTFISSTGFLVFLWILDLFFGLPRRLTSPLHPTPLGSEEASLEWSLYGREASITSQRLPSLN